MTTQSTRPDTGTSVAQAERPPFSRRVLKLEHPANIGPLAHIALWLSLLASVCWCRAPRPGTWRCR